MAAAPDSALELLDDETDGSLANAGGGPAGDAANGAGARLLAIAGCTNAGKTTLAKKFVQLFIEEGQRVELVSQDNFYYPADKVEKKMRRSMSGASLMSGSGNGEPLFYYDYDSAKAVNERALCERVREAAKSVDYVLIEGNMLTELPELMEMVDRVVFLTLNESTCRRRRALRRYDPPDIGNYFDEVVWPSYRLHLMNALAIAREDSRITFLDASREKDDQQDKHIMKLIQTLSDDVIRITFDVLSIQEASKMVASPSCGATSLFVGTTRDTFNGRAVIRLEYESYDEMAYMEMRSLCWRLRQCFPTVERCVIFHRIGEVTVGEISVIIACSSPHRADAIRATEWAIDELKRTVPIWKKEAYADGSASWKENAEWHLRRNSEEHPPCNNNMGTVHAAEGGGGLAISQNEQLPLTPDLLAEASSPPDAILAPSSSSHTAASRAALERDALRARRGLYGEARIRAGAFFH